MRIILMTILIVTSFSSIAQSTGVCKSKPGSDYMGMLCHQQGSGSNGKYLCKITNGCQWISLTSKGVCLNRPGQDYMALLCKNQGSQANGEQFCKMTNGCRWVETD